MSLNKQAVEKTKLENYRTNLLKTQAEWTSHFQDQKYHSQVAEVQMHADIQREVQEQESRKTKAMDNAVLLKRQLEEERQKRKLIELREKML